MTTPARIRHGTLVTDVRVAFAGVYAHGGPVPADVRRQVLGDTEPLDLGGLQVAADPTSRAAGGFLKVIGRVTRRPDLDLHLGTSGASDAELLRAVYARYGEAGWLRVPGAWALAYFEPTEGVLWLARAPGVAAPLVYVVRKGHYSAFASAVEPLRELAGPPDVGLLDVWVETGLWPSAERTALTELETLPPGSTLMINAKGRNRRGRFWTFTPLVVPRRLPLEAARAEVMAQLELSVDAAPLVRPVLLDGAGPARAVLTSLFPGATPAPAQAAEPSEGALQALLRRMPGPLPRSRLLDLAKLPAGVPVASTVGADPLLGLTRGALIAYLRTLAHALEARPHPRLLFEVLKRGRPIARALQAPFLEELQGSAKRVLDRWGRHFPVELMKGPLGRLAAADPPPVGPVLTGDAFLDRRYAEALDRTIELERLALGLDGRSVSAPFAEVEVFELLFQLPPEHLLGADGRPQLLGPAELPTFSSEVELRRDRAAGAELYRRC